MENAEGPKSTGSKFIGALALTFSALLMSTLSIFVRNIHADSLSVTFFRFSSALIFVILFLLVKKQIPAVRNRLMFVLALFNLSTVVCYITAIQKVEVATAALLLYMAPIYVLPVARLMGERIERETWIAIPLGIFGLYLMLTPYAELNAGLVAGILSGLSYAAVIVLIKLLSDQTPTEITFFNLLIGSAALLPWAIANFPGFGEVGVNWVVGLGLIPTAIPFILFAYGVQHVKVQTAPIFALIEPLSASVIGFVVFGESLAVQQIIGGAMILSSISLAWRA